MKSFVRTAALLLLLAVAWSIHVYHLGVYPAPDPSALKITQSAAAVWIDKEKYGMHQLVLFGTPYERGLEAGKLTKHLLLRHERELNEQLANFISSTWLLRALSVAGIRWFYGIERYFEPWMTEEMYGVSKSAPREYDYLLDGFTRQVALHGLHEVGQLMVDQGSEDMGCTVVAVPRAGSWVVGRNFDFEGGRTFDTEKIVKWVFPSEGHAFVSVIWAGMVGAVTGVNEHGLYLSLNAAGSRDFRRHGTPSTLVLLKALQFAKNAEEALAILKKETMFITDIFVLLDSKSGKLYRVEKSPERTEVIALTEPSVVTNHLIAKAWADDRINLYRRDELTSNARAVRGERLLRSLDHRANPVESVVRVLRDKGVSNDGEPLHLGNRRAIDAMIATHAVVLDAPAQVLYVSRGPGVSGAFTGFDLKASFKERRPVAKGALGPDPQVSAETFAGIRASAKEIARAEAFVRKERCEEADNLLRTAAGRFKNQNGYYLALGNFFETCRKDLASAKEAWRKALSLSPAYPRQVRYLEEKLRQ